MTKPKPPGATATNQAIGQRLRALRLARQLSQAKLADRVGLAFQQIQRYETGGNVIPAWRLIALAEAFDVPVTYFLDGLADTSPASPPSDAATKLAHRIDAMPTPQRKALVSLVTAVTESHSVLREGVAP